MAKAKLDLIMRGVQRKLDDGSAPTTVSATEVYKRLQTHQLVRKASDFVSVFGPDMYVIYGCTGCDTYPLRSSSWYRCVKMDQVNSAGGTYTRGHWRCCACLKR